MANRIHSKGAFRYEEFDAGEAGIYPGMLLEVNSSGDVIKHNTEGARAEKMFAQEDALQGKTVDDVYTANNPVGCILPVSGSEVNALIEDGQDISIGEELISAGNGCLKSASDLESGETLSEVIAIAAEACDLTGSGTSNTLAAVRVK